MEKPIHGRYLFIRELAIWRINVLAQSQYFQQVVPLCGIRNLQRFEVEKAAAIAQVSGPLMLQRQQLNDQHDATMHAMQATAQQRWFKLQAEWNQKIPPLLASVEEIEQDPTAQLEAWTTSYQPHELFPNAVRFGALKLDLSPQAALFAKETPFDLSGHERITLPLALSFPQEGSLLIETDDDGGKWVADVMNDVIFRLFTQSPPGKVHFTIIDAVGLGQNFAGLMHLADYEPALINRRIWTQREQIEERLIELNEHVEKVIQMYLRNEYATITEYNAQAGSVAEKYHFLVIAGLPAGFNESSMARLKSIVMSGARCGVFVLIHWDKRQPLPEGLSAEDLRKNCLRIVREKGVVSFNGIRTLELDAPPPDAIAADLAHQIGQASIDSNRVQVPFSVVTPKELWSESTTNELRIAIGRTGADGFDQLLDIGSGALSLVEKTAGCTADKLEAYVANPANLASQWTYGSDGYKFSMQAMDSAYQAVYDQQLRRTSVTHQDT